MSRLGNISRKVFRYMNLNRCSYNRIESRCLSSPSIRSDFAALYGIVNMMLPDGNLASFGLCDVILCFRLVKFEPNPKVKKKFPCCDSHHSCPVSVTSWTAYNSRYSPSVSLSGPSTRLDIWQRKSVLPKR